MIKLFRRVPVRTKGCGCLDYNETGYVYMSVELLAEFEGSVYKKDLTDAQSGGQQTLQIVGENMGKTNYREVTVLILEKGDNNGKET